MSDRAQLALFVVERLRFSRFIWFAAQLYLLLIVQQLHFLFLLDRGHPGAQNQLRLRAECPAQKIVENPRTHTFAFCSILTAEFLKWSW